MATSFRDHVLFPTHSGFHTLIDADSRERLVARMKLANSFWRRFRGWQWRGEPATDEGLLLAPCGSIHTHWMRFTIGIVWCDAEGQILSTMADVRPWSYRVGPTGSFAVIELPARVDLARFVPGARVDVVPSS